MIAKPRPKLLEKRQRKADVAKIDREENAKVKQRSGGRCERIEVVTPIFMFNARTMAHKEPALVAVRCRLRASHVHHLISGIGRRNVGKSIEAAHKLHVCSRCHDEIHGRVLVPVNAYEKEAAATVKYERMR